MVWVWSDDDEPNELHSKSHGGFERRNPNLSDTEEICSTRKVVKTQCKMEEVEPGKFLRKCEKTEELLRNCLGKPAEVLESNKEYTEEDVTDQVVRGSFPEHQYVEGPFSFPGLRNDIESIERHLMGGFGRFLEAAEEMQKNFFDTFGGSSSSPSTRRRVPIQGHPSNQGSRRQKESISGGDVDLSDLGSDV